jgi:hypothetical protein
MKPTIQNTFIAMSVACLVIAVTALGQTGGPYVLEWSTVDAGGGTSAGGPYSLTGTIGQPDAAYSAGGQYELLGGFWPGGPLCFVDFEDFANFAEHWLDWPCDQSNNWCGGADLNQLDGVDWTDLRLFVYEWLLECPYRWPLR